MNTCRIAVEITSSEYSINGRFESDACFRHMKSNNQLKQNKIDELKRLLQEGDLYTQDIADLVGCSPATVSNYARKFGISRKRHKHRMTYAEIDQCVELYQQGMTLQQIAAKFGVHYTTVMKHTHGAGLQRHDRRKKHGDVFPAGRSSEYTEEMFRRAIHEEKVIAKIGEEYARRYKRLIFHRAQQVKEILNYHVYKEIEIWASSAIATEPGTAKCDI